MRRALPRVSGPARCLLRPRHALPLVLAVGLSLSLAVFFVARRLEEREMRDRFERAAGNRASAIRRTADHVVRDLEAVAAFFRASDAVSRAEFHSFAGHLLGNHQHDTGILEWIPRVPDSERARYEEAARADGYPRFEFTEEGEPGARVRAGRRPAYYPVYYVEPPGGNEGDLGLDLASTPALGGVLRSAERPGEAPAGAHGTLARERSGGAALLISMPVFREGPRGTAGAAGDRPRGFVLGVYGIAQMVESTLGYLAPEGVDVYVLDDAAPARERLLYFHPSRLRTSPTAPLGEEELRRGTHRDDALQLADWRWRIVCAPSPELLAAHATWRPWAILSAGLLATVLLAGYILLVLTRAARAREHADQLLRAKDALEAEIAERRRAEEALRGSQQRLQDILQNAHEGIWVVDADGMTELVNARLLEIFRLREDMVGRPFLDMVPHRARRIAEADLRAVRRGETIHREFALHGAGADEVRVLLSRSPLRGADGRIVGDVGIFTDITAHRRAEEQLLQAQKMEAIGQLASGIAHDFNNLLVVIKSCAGFLLASLAAGDPRRGDADEIGQAAERATHLVRQLLAFGRKSPVTPVVVDLNGAVRDVEQLLRRTLGDGIAIAISCATAEPRTLIDRGQLEQILINLAVNARDAMGGRGALFIETREEAIDESAAAHEGVPPGRYAVLAVKDTGCGMSPEVARRIFEPFFTTKEEGRGTGLGLSTVYGIVQQAEGRIAVASAPGQGATFTVYLPAWEGPEERAQRAGRAPDAANRPEA